MKKNGFTLVQLMITLFIVSLLLAAAAPMITRAHKKIPQRAVHGRYYCYYDGNGILTEEYYNSKTRISQTHPDSCSFTPPNKVASYKVELVGGGAGGSYQRASEDNSDSETGTFEMRGLTLGDNRLLPPNGVIFDAFHGAQFVECANTGRGQTGGNLKYYAYYANRAKAGKWNGDLLDVNMSNIYVTSHEIKKGRLGDEDTGTQLFLAHNIFGGSQGNSRCNGQNDPLDLDPCDKYDEFIKEQKWPDDWYIRIAEEYEEISGQSGSPNQYLKYTGTINLDDSNDYESTLQSIKNTVKGGYCTNSDCSNNSFVNESIPSSFPYIHPIEYTDGDVDLPAYGTDGASQDKYAAIKREDGTFYVASGTAQGGLGACVDVISGPFVIDCNTCQYLDKTAVSDTEVCEPKSNAEPVPGTESTCNSQYPSLDITLNGYKRTYTYGAGGEAGEYRVFNYANLPNDCTLTPGLGGTAGNSLSNNGGAGGNTRMVCSEGNIEISADGGQENTSVKTHDYDLLSELLDDINEEIQTHVYTSEVQTGGSSPYQSSTNVFTPYRNAPDGFGAGGDGNQIKDSKAKPYGRLTYTAQNGANDVSDKGKSWAQEGPELTNEQDATAGRGGAIIITW